MARAGGEAGGGRPALPPASAPAEQFLQIQPEAAGAITFGHLGAKNLGAFFTVVGPRTLPQHRGPLEGLALVWIKVVHTVGEELGGADALDNLTAEKMVQIVATTFLSSRSTERTMNVHTTKVSARLQLFGRLKNGIQ
jgi:hypothetical protein